MMAIVHATNNNVSHVLDSSSSIQRRSFSLQSEK